MPAVWSSWTVLGAFGDGTNWYDGNGNVNALGTGSDGWTGTTTTTQAIPNHFETATIELPVTLHNSNEIQYLHGVVWNLSGINMQI